MITHPAYRNRGFGKAVRSAAAADCVQQGYTARYQTLLSNQPAISIAESLGFEHYATHFAVRFK